MGRTKTTFSQADVKRAVKGALQAGLRIARLEINDQGKIVLVAEEPVDSQAKQLNEDVSKLL
jgi:hypothetical protein